MFHYNYKLRWQQSSWIRVLALKFTRSARILKSSHSRLDRIARNRLRGDDYIRDAGLLVASRGTNRHSNLASIWPLQLPRG